MAFNHFFPGSNSGNTPECDFALLIINSNTFFAKGFAYLLNCSNLKLKSLMNNTFSHFCLYLKNDLILTVFNISLNNYMFLPK